MFINLAKLRNKSGNRQNNFDLSTIIQNCLESIGDESVTSGTIAHVLDATVKVGM